MKKVLIAITVIMLVVSGMVIASMKTKIVVTPDNPSPSFNIQLSINKGNGAVYSPGENISVSFRTNRDAYVVLYDIQPNGKVHILFPNRYDPNNFVRANQTYYLPRQGYNFMVENTPGTEYIQAVASTQQFVHYNQWQQEFNNSVFPPVSMNAKDYFSDFQTKIAVTPDPQIMWTSAIASFNVQPYQQKGYLSCTSHPGGAQIWVDGRFTGRRTPATLSLAAGNHMIRFVIPNHKAKSQYVRVDPGVTTNLFMDILN